MPSTSAERPPRWFWLLPGSIVLLRALPFFWSYIAEPETGQTLLHLGYAPRDFLAYLSFIRQFAEDGSAVAANAFTTLPQDPRFILPFHWVLGVVAGLTRLSPTIVLEFMRIPLTFVFFWTVWWFLQPLISGRRERLTAAVLIGFSGGIEGWVAPLVDALPADFNPDFIAQSTWHLYGWNTFASLYNPLWIAGLTLTLVALRPLITAATPTRRTLAVFSGTTFALIFVHPYSAVVVLAVAVLRPFLYTLLRSDVDWRREGTFWVWLAPALVVAFLILQWQRQDAVFTLAAQNFFGTLALPVFWYPITLGAVGLLAVRGAMHWITEEHPYRFGVLSWLVAVVALHTSPIVNGYHYVMHLHLPLAIFGASALVAAWDAATDARPWHRLATLFLVIFLFASPVFVTLESLGDVTRRNAIPAEYTDLTRTLSEKPPGSVFAPPALGNVLPAYSGHRVWAGHWFLTPEFGVKLRQYEALTERPGEGLARLTESESIRYVVVESLRAARVREVLRATVVATQTVGRYTLIELAVSE